MKSHEEKKINPEREIWYDWLEKKIWGQEDTLYFIRLLWEQHAFS